MIVASGKATFFWVTDTKNTKRSRTADERGFEKGLATVQTKPRSCERNPFDASSACSGQAFHCLVLMAF
jgi:hypothetical protein